MKKRLLNLSLAATVAALVLSACGAATPAPTAVPPKPTEAPKPAATAAPAATAVPAKPTDVPKPAATAVPAATVAPSRPTGTFTQKIQRQVAMVTMRPPTG